MALTTAFGTMGATPSFSTGTTSQSTPMTGSTPAAKALNNASTPFNGGSTPNGLFAGSTPPPAPTQPIASQVHTDASGNSVKTTYQTPETGMLNSSSAPTNTQPPASSGLLNNSGTVIDNTTGQTAGGGYINPGNTGGTTPNGTTVDASGNIISPGSSPSTLSSITSGLINTAGGNAAIGQNAANIASNYGKQIADVGNQAAINEESVGGQGLLPTAMGRAQQVAQTANTAETALATGESAALQGTGQELTAQGQEAGALGTAGGLATPTGSFPFAFNPLTGQFTNASGSSSTNTSGAPTLTYNPQTDASTLAKMVIANQLPYSDAVSALGYAGGVGTGLLQTAIASQGGNLTQIEAQQAATQSNINTAGTASTNSWNSIYNTANTAAANYTQQQNAINAVGTQALNLMSQNGINPSSSQFANVKLNQLSTQFSSPQYAAFNTAIQSLQARISSALQAGEIPTAATSNAQAIANGDVTLSALAATLKQVNDEMGAFVGTQQSLASYAQSQLNNPSGNTTSTNTTNSTTSPTSGGWGSLGD